MKKERRENGESILVKERKKLSNWIMKIDKKDKKRLKKEDLVKSKGNINIQVLRFDIGGIYD